MPAADKVAVQNPAYAGQSAAVAVNPDGSNINGYSVVSKTVAYAGGTLNDPGDFDGNDNPDPLFTVSGQVLLAIIAVVSTTLTGASATIKVGKAGAVTRYLPSLTGTTLVAGSTWDSTGLVAAGTAPLTTPNQAALDAESIIATIATADVTAGQITFYAFYKALSPGATVVAAA